MVTPFKSQPEGKFPNIQLPTLSTGETINIGKPEGEGNWKMVILYRGQHCPLCTNFLNKVEMAKADFTNLGVEIIAVSADNFLQVEAHTRKGLSVTFPIAYGLSVGEMLQLGLYISEPRSTAETDHLFNEPALFVINDKGMMHIIDISNAPFIRPDINVLLGGIKYIRDNAYPIRGTYV